VHFNAHGGDIRLDKPSIAGSLGNRGILTMDVNERIQKQLDAYPVLLYMKGSPDFPQCGFSARTVAALRAVDAKFAYVDIFEDPEIREGLKAFSNWPTFPQLYIKGELVGGCDICVELHESGELAEMVESAAQPESSAAPSGSEAS
jgi:monothiol glutaredoxin